MESRGRMRRISDRGSGSIPVVLIVAVVVLVTVLGFAVAEVLRARQQAGIAADFAALAGSQAAVNGGDGCAAAREIAQHNGAELVACQMDVAVTTVTARVYGPSWIGSWGFEQRARAAPRSYLD